MKSEKKKERADRVKRDPAEANQLIKQYYQQRAVRLHSLKLDDITANVPFGLWSPESESADKVVARLIEKYLVTFEDWWLEATQDADFCLSALRMRRQANIPQRFRYEKELGAAHGRLTLAFINHYCTADYEIDWRKVIVFNTRKN